MTRVTRSALGSKADNAGLVTPSPGPARRYRRVVRLTIPTGSAAQRITILPDTVMDVTFSAMQFNATGADAAEPATLSSGSNGLVLRLPVARRIAAVRLDTTQGGDAVAAFRFDGPVVSDDPVAVATHGANGAPIDVVDAQLILRRRRAGTDMGLSVGEVDAVTVAAEPAQPHVAFAIVGDPAGEVALPPDTDASGAPVVRDSASWGPRLAAALTAQAARLGQPTLPNPLLVDLILEDDTPCAAAITAFDLGYTLERSGFSDTADKQVLRFSSGSGQAQTVTIDLPSGIHALSATVRLSLAGAATPAALRRAGASAGGGVAAGATQGVAVVPATLAAAYILLDTASVITGADLLMGAVETPAEIVASLWEDAGGLPSRHLDDSAPVRLASAKPQAVPVTFSPAVTLPAGPVWLAVSVRRGRAVLGLRASSTGRVATGDGSAWTVLSAAAGQDAAVQLRMPGSAEDAVGGSSGPVVTLAGSALPIAVDGPARVVEFADRINALPAPRPAQLVLSVRADGGGVITIDPPVLRYEPA